MWPGKPITAHWGVPDPAAVHGSDDEMRRAFEHAFTALSGRIDRLLQLPPEKLTQEKLSEIGSS